MPSFVPHTDAEIESDARLPRARPASTNCSPRSLPPSAWREPRPPAGISEPDLVARLWRARRAQPRGSGAGSSASPAAAPTTTRCRPSSAALAGRSEFVTAYTPYQPEVAQGVLQALFEYQTMVARLAGLEIANASLYDGAAALVEAVNLATASTGRRPACSCSQGVNPRWRAGAAHLRRGDAGTRSSSLPLTGRGHRLRGGCRDRAGRGDRRRLPELPRLPRGPGGGAGGGRPLGALLVVCQDPIAAGLLGESGPPRRRRRRRRGPGARQPARLRRPLPRAVLLPSRARPPAARPPRRRDGRRRGTARLRHDARARASRTSGARRPRPTSAPTRR